MRLFKNIFYVQVPLYLAHAKGIFAYPCDVQDFIKAQEGMFVKIFSAVLKEKKKMDAVESVHNSEEKPWNFLALAAAVLCGESDFLEVVPVSY